MVDDRRGAEQTAFCEVDGPVGIGRRQSYHAGTEDIDVSYRCRGVDPTVGDGAERDQLAAGGVEGEVEDHRRATEDTSSGGSDERMGRVEIHV